MQALVSNHMRHHLHATQKIMVIILASREAFPQSTLCIVAVTPTPKMLPFAVIAGHEHTAYICQLTAQLALSVGLLQSLITPCLLQQTPPRRIYRRIKRGNAAGKGSAPAAAAVAASQTATTSSASQIPSQAPAVLEFDVTEARKAAAKWGQMGPQSAPLMIWPLHSGEPLQAQVVRADQVQDKRPDAEEASPPLLEESSSSSRVNTKKRSAPTTLVNTPQMLQQLAKEGSSRDSTCSSNSDDTGSQESDGSDESEPDVVSRQQHPFGMQNGLAATADSQKGILLQGQGSTAAGPTPAALPRSLSPVPVTGVMTASQIRQRRQQEMAMPSTGYHVPGGTPVAHKAVPTSSGASMQADPVPVHLKHALMGKQMLDMVDGFGRAPLHVAAGRVDVVQQLLFGGCDYTKALQADFRCSNSLQQLKLALA